MDLRHATPGAPRFAVDLDLCDKRRDVLHRLRQGIRAPYVQAPVFQRCPYAFANGPDLGVTQQCGHGLYRMLGDHVVERADKALIRAEDDGANWSSVAIAR
jgi:hypothetical protein